jgi:DnaJ-class molecular chaperone
MNQTTCLVCGGSGQQTLNNQTTTCPRCNGTGTVIVGQVQCSVCGGSGKPPGAISPCQHCRGTGWVNQV